MKQTCIYDSISSVFTGVSEGYKVPFTCKRNATLWQKQMKTKFSSRALKNTCIISVGNWPQLHSTWRAVGQAAQSLASFLSLWVGLWLSLCLDFSRQKWRPPKILVCGFVFSFSMKQSTCREVRVCRLMSTKCTSVTREQSMTNTREGPCPFRRLPPDTRGPGC